VTSNGQFGDRIDWNAEARRAAAEGVPGVIPGPMVTEVCAALSMDGGEADPEPTPRLVDCGCNIARFYPEVTKAGLTYTGVDQAAEALAIAKNRYPGIDLINAMLWDEWPKGRAKFDAAICNAVLQHNNLFEKVQILYRIAEAVRPGGVFVMQESTVPVETDTQLQQGEWIEIVECYGFKLIKLWHPNAEYKILDGYVFRRV
jgi:SAM-dependent methyltransferase